MSRSRSSRGFPWIVMIGISLAAIVLIGTVVLMQPAPVKLSLDPITKQTVAENETLTVKPVAHIEGASPRTLRYSLISGPKGAEIDPQKGVLTWTPSEAQTGKTHRVEIRVSQGAGKVSVSTKFSIFVKEGLNEPPIIFEVGELTAVAGEPLMFLVRAADPDVPPKPLEFKFGAAAPSGSRLDPVTGSFEWTPPASAKDHDEPVEVIVTDSGGLSASTKFTIHVTSTKSAAATPNP